MCYKINIVFVLQIEDKILIVIKCLVWNKNQMELVLLRFSSASMIALRVRGNWNVCCSIISKFWPLTISLSLSFSLYLSFSIFLYLSLYIYLFFLSVFSSNILIFDYHSVLVFQINWPIIICFVILNIPSYVAKQ
jgi:hypothetical protein